MTGFSTQALRLGILASFIGCLSAPAQAAVTTIGCVSSTACTFAELLAGGSITVNDVTFHTWSLQTEAGEFDADDITVTGIDEVPLGGGTGRLGLSFAFSPALDLGPLDTAEGDWDFTATVNAPSTRVLTSSTLELTTAAITGDAFVEVNGDMGASGLLTVGLPTPGATDTQALASLSAVLVDMDVQGESFDEESGASLGTFNSFFDVFASIDVIVPEPGTWALMIAGFALLGWRVRRRAFAR